MSRQSGREDTPSPDECKFFTKIELNPGTYCTLYVLSITECATYAEFTSQNRVGGYWILIDSQSEPCDTPGVSLGHDSLRVSGLSDLVWLYLNMNLGSLHYSKGPRFAGIGTTGQRRRYVDTWVDLCSRCRPTARCRGSNYAT
jgi:hypothetical protein